MALPSLNALQAAEAVGRLGSLSRAAAALGVTPSAVSHRLRGLEQQLGLGLFERGEAGLAPTAAGRRLLPGLSEGFQRIAAAVAEATAQERGTVTVTCGLAFAAKWLVPRLVGLAARHPELEVRLVTTSRLVEFDREDIDLGIRFGRGRWPGLKAELVAPQPLIPVASPSIAAVLADSRSVSADRGRADPVRLGCLAGGRRAGDRRARRPGRPSAPALPRRVAGGRGRPGRPRRVAGLAAAGRRGAAVRPAGPRLSRPHRRRPRLLAGLHPRPLAPPRGRPVPQLADRHARRSARKTTQLS